MAQALRVCAYTLTDLTLQQSTQPRHAHRREHLLQHQSHRDQSSDANDADDGASISAPVDHKSRSENVSVLGEQASTSKSAASRSGVKGLDESVDGSKL